MRKNLRIKTQTELAEYLGLARMTVHRALAGNPGVNEKTREHICTVAREVGYRPNAAARVIRNGAFNSIALISCTHSGAGFMPQELLCGAQQVANKYDMKLIVNDYSKEELINPNLGARLLRESSADGMIVNYHHSIPDKMYNLIESCKLPTIWLNARLHKNTVRPDDYKAGYDAAMQLIKNGFRKIGYICVCGERHYSIQERLSGVTAAVHDNGIADVITYLSDDYGNLDIVEKAVEWLSGADAPEAVICYEKQETVAIYSAAMKLGLRIPEDLSLIAFSQQMLRKSVALPVSTYIVPFDEVGTVATTKIIEQVNAEKLEDYEEVKIPFAYDEASSIKYQ